MAANYDETIWDSSIIDDLKRDLNINYHILSATEVCRLLKTHPDNGLSHGAAQKALANDGPNTFTPAPTIPEWVKYTKHWFNGFALLLWLCSGLAIFLDLVCHSEYESEEFSYNTYTSLSLATVVVCTSMFQYFLEPPATKVIENFKKLIPVHAHVIRDGKNMQIRAEDLVIGDLIELEGGDPIPADIRVIYAEKFKVNSRALTGSSALIEMTTEHTSLNPSETLNLAFLSSTAVEGVAKGIVIACGDHTAVGRTARLTANLETRKSPIIKEILYVIRVISLIALFTAIFISCIAFLLFGAKSYDVIELFIDVTLAIIPEGLIATLIINLTLFEAFSTKKNMTIKNLYAIEALGSVSIICTDKTGTLTMNDLIVSHVWLNSELEPIDMKTFLDNVQLRTFELKALFLAVIICNDYDFTSKYLNSTVHPTFDRCEIALLNCADRLYRHGQATKHEYAKIAEIPLVAGGNSYLSIHRVLKNASYMIAIKGNPEVVLSLCSTTLLNKTDVAIDEDFRTKFKKILLILENLGENVLAFGDCHLPPEDYPIDYQFDLMKPNFPMKNYRFLGIVSLIDPVRPDVRNSIAQIRSAGVRVFMCSGDNIKAAKIVARATGIILPQNETVEDIAQRLDISLTEVNSLDARAAVINCSEFGYFTKDKLEYLLRNYEDLVFARASPQQKLSIVENCQNLGALVGAIGNDINDCAALKQADVSIAMGASRCADIINEVADIILVDNNFKSIVNSIESGRLIFDNLKKVIAFILISNMSLLLPFIFHGLIGTPNASRPLIVLIIEIGINLLPSFALSLESAEGNLLERKPRNPYTDRLVNPNMFLLCYAMLGTIAAAGNFCAYLTVMYDNGFDSYNLYGISTNWTNESINDLVDSGGFEWTHRYRTILEQTAHTAYFVGIIETQWAAAIICRTRINSIFKQGMKNWMLNLSIIITGFLAGFIIYSPVSFSIGIYPLNFRWWLSALPFAVLMIIFDECRKKVMSRNQNSWITKNTFY